MGRALEAEISLKVCAVFANPSEGYHHVSPHPDNCLKAGEIFFRKGEQRSKQKGTPPLSVCNMFLPAFHQ